MPLQPANRGETAPEDESRLTRRWLAVLVGAAVFVTLILPLVPILLGVILIALVALHAGSPELRPYVQPFLGLPVGAPRKRHTRMALIAGAGVLLVLLGSTTAALRGNWRGTREQRAEQRTATEDRVTTLYGRAEELLAKGDVAGAKLALIDARSVENADEDDTERIDALLERIERSGDTKTIAAIVARLSEKEVAALKTGASVPEDLDFGAKALTYRAVELALVLVSARDS